MSDPSFHTASLSASSSYLMASQIHSDDTDDDVDSLPSTAASDSSLEGEFSIYSDDDESDAEREWNESLQQLELLLSMMIIPFVGKFLGRKCAYWGWARFMEWKYPVEVVVSSKAVARGAGIIEAASPL
ncbi:hypothetical protein AJ80_02093 [Polytolypa hystricis UAMH7299]|uniref:Uncharacterized protein n=1 Tax=Polytolypa hystricis (strain UAMH7299) TaxID=1447883 RepID=A0A2B7YRA3_POLH7|nr:hypothetical protein AJ80_02093 [Polytolypa hystricis UAMH7299]